jgi:hypothetical protein
VVTAASNLINASFITPDHVPGTPTAMPNQLGPRNVSFEVDDLQTALDRVAEDVPFADRSPSFRRPRAAHMLETAESMSPTTASAARCQP